MTTLLEETIQPDKNASRSDFPTAAAPPGGSAGKAVQRLSNAPLPRPVARLISASKKLVWTVLEARLVTTPLRYAYRELFGSGIADYQLRQSGIRFAVRHKSGDVDIFRKFYAYRYYEWPAAVRDKLTALGRPINTLDLGGNIGFFEVHTREQMPVGQVVAFEPDPANGSVWERVRDANSADWELVRACASNREGTVRFKSGAHNFSRISGDGDFTVEALDAFPYIEQADLVKVNIEGSEWEILEDPRMMSTDQVWIVEYHRIRNPSSDITAHVCKLLEQAGYTTEVTASHIDNGLVWAWRPDGR